MCACVRTSVSVRACLCVCLCKLFCGIFPHIYDTFWRLYVLSGVVRLTCTQTCRARHCCECVWKYVCPTSAALRVSAASFIPPDIRAFFLWAQEQLATPVGHSHNEGKNTIFQSGYTHTHTYIREREGEKNTHSPGLC